MWYTNFLLKFAGVKEDVLRIVGGDSNLLNQVRQICPEPKFQAAIAYFLVQGADTGQLSEYVQKLAKLQQSQKLKSLFVSKSGVHFNDKIFTDWISFTEAVDGLMPPPALKDLHAKHQASGDTLISKGKNIEVHKANNVADAINLGSGMGWCISQPGNTMYQSYRDTQESTFYFVIDHNRDVLDPLHRVVVDMANQNVLLTDMNNDTNHISEFGDDADAYFDYLQEQGVDTAVFKHDPITPEEIKETRDLVTVPRGMKPEERSEWFKNLSFEYKSKFIGRGNKLSFSELQYLVNSNLKDLVSQYLNIGEPMSKDEFALISGNNQWRNTYIRARGNRLQNANLMIQEEDAQIPGLIIPLFEAGKIAFERLPYSLKKDPEFALNAFNVGKTTFVCLPESIRQDPEFALKAWKEGKVQFGLLPKSLKEDPEFALKAWKEGKATFNDLPDFYRKDPEFAYNALKAGMSYYYIPKSLKENLEFVLNAFNTGVLQFFELPPSLKENPEFVLNALSSGMVDFYQVPESLRQDQNFALKVFNMGKAQFFLLPKSFQNDPEFALNAFNTGRAKFSELPINIQKMLQDKEQNKEQQAH